MPQAKAVKSPSKADSRKANPFQLRKDSQDNKEVHIIGPGIVCDTEDIGHVTPRGRSRVEIVVDSSEGFIPLWAKGTTLRWRFRESSFHQFQNPAAAKAKVKQLFGNALLAWGDAAPVKFSQRDDTWDFEIVMKSSDSCDANGCVLASAFFPDAGRHKLLIYPKMFTQDAQEQLETLAHEIGHVFGLRHFFAKISETQWASEIFGTHNPFSIMNYGAQSKLTDADKADLKRLYQGAWSGEFNQINGTQIRFVKPFHTLGMLPDTLVAVAPLPPASPQPQAALVGRI